MVGGVTRHAYRFARLIERLRQVHSLKGNAFRLTEAAHKDFVAARLYDSDDDLDHTEDIIEAIEQQQRPSDNHLTISRSGNQVFWKWFTTDAQAGSGTAAPARQT